MDAVGMLRTEAWYGALAALDRSEGHSCDILIVPLY